MNLGSSSSAIPFNKDILLYLGLGFIALGLLMMVYYGIKLHGLKQGS